MLRFYIRSLGIFCLAIATFFINPPTINAKEIVISPFIQVEGLTLDNPQSLPFSQDPAIFTTLNFQTSSLVIGNQTPNPLEDLFTPPLTLDATSSATPSPSPTPKPQIPLPKNTPPPATTDAAITPAKTPSPAATPSSPSSTQLSTPGGLNADVLFQMVNDYRTALNLPIFTKDDKSCALAASRAPEVGAEIAGGYMHQGLRARDLPYWNTENIISMRTEQEAFNWWINDAIHREAILGDYKYSCLACSGNSCAEEFTNYQPK